jgi:phosphohistidine phosphatase
MADPVSIYLLRHAIAEDARPGMSDPERTLTDEGRTKLRRVLKRARAAGVAPSLILSSPYRRALETADMAAQALGYQGKIVETTALEPMASPRDAWDVIRQRHGEDAILLATHGPLVGSLVAFLLRSPALDVDMKKAALVRIDCQNLSPEPNGVLKWMLTPAVSGD